MKKEILFHVNSPVSIEHGCVNRSIALYLSEITWLWNSTDREEAVGICSALLLSTVYKSVTLCSALSWSSKTSSVFHLQCVSSSPRNAFFSKKRTCVHSRSDRGARLNRDKSPPLVPDWLILMQIRTPNPHSLIGPKSTVLTGQNGAALIGQQIC